MTFWKNSDFSKFLNEKLAQAIDPGIINLKWLLKFLDLGEWIRPNWVKRRKTTGEKPYEKYILEAF